MVESWGGVSTPLVTKDLTATRCVEDMAWALEQLEVTLEGIFDRIKDKADVEKQRISSIKSRVAACELKVANMATMKNRATTVLSTARYPLGTKTSGSLSSGVHLSFFFLKKINITKLFCLYEKVVMSNR